MNALLSMRVRGWACSSSPGHLIEALLGNAAWSRRTTCEAGKWCVKDPVQSQDPFGPIRSVLVFETESGSELEIVPGSMGLGPPPDDAGHAIVRPAIEPPETLLLDARCWYRLPEGANARCSLWLFSPEVTPLG